MQKGWRHVSDINSIFAASLLLAVRKSTYTTCFGSNISLFDGRDSLLNIPRRYTIESVHGTYLLALQILREYE